MTDIPSAVLSEQFQERMKKRRVVSALFTTFRFEPGFFESEILPVFFDMPLSHAPAMKLVQLDDVLRSLPGSIAVYYDHAGLVPEGGPAKLDVRRIPIHHPTGIFHPKNVLVLVEEQEPDKDGRRARTLLCACSSANLTRAGWWENVEVAHIEEIAEGSRTSLGEALVGYLDALIRAAEGRRPNDELRNEHVAVRDIRAFLKDTSPREHRSVNGRFLTHFHDGKASLPDFIESVAGSSLKGFCLEVISPYFDGGETSAPLVTLRDRFTPAEVRVFLPRGDTGEAQCTEGLHAWVKGLPATSWGALPADLLRLGKGEDTKNRRVHAKVYRFFEPKRGGREVLYVGSPNLTTAGCRPAGRGGNWETGFLVEATRPGRPDWWLSSDTRRPAVYAPREETEGAATSGGSSLILRFRWDTHEASAFWRAPEESPPLSVRQGGAPVLELDRLPPQEWTVLAPEQSRSLERVLASTSLLEVVRAGAEPATVLVQEEGMAQRPSLLLALSAADILRFWALLTPEQRAAALEQHVRLGDDDNPLGARYTPLPFATTLFDTLAGVFHAFGCLEGQVRTALVEDRAREADYRLFGRKYDSLGTLLDRVLDDIRAEKGDRVEHYLVMLCAKQLLREVGRTFPDYWASHRNDVKELEALLQQMAPLREALKAEPEFLDWFEHWFLRRAAALSEERES